MKRKARIAIVALKAANLPREVERWLARVWGIWFCRKETWTFS